MKSFNTLLASTVALASMRPTGAQSDHWRGPRAAHAERAGERRAAERLTRHRAIWANTPDASRMTRQRRRWLHRHGLLAA